MPLWLTRYRRFIKGPGAHSYSSSTLEASQDGLFVTFLVYCFPLSSFAAAPGIFMALKDGYLFVAIADAACFLALGIITFYTAISLGVRKRAVIGLFYFVAIYLTSTLGYMGPGVFFLFANTIIIALILPIRFAFRSIAVNALIILAFALIIRYGLFNSLLIRQYSFGKWLAFGSNIVFLSLLTTLLIQRILSSLQRVIGNATQLQQTYQNIFARSPVPMWVFETATMKFLDVNDSAIRNYGYSKKEFLEMTLKDIRAEEDIINIEETVSRNRISGNFYQCVSRHRKKCGEYLYAKIESNIFVFNDVQARIVLATDITEVLRKETAIEQANYKVKESEANLRAIFESTIDGFILLDSHCIIKAANQRANDYLKFEMNQVQFKPGANIFGYIDQTKAEYFNNVLKRAYSGEYVHYDRKYVSDNGQPYWIHFTVTPVYQDANICGACITGRNITESKAYINTIERQNKAFREISWMQSHLVRAPLARVMGLSNLLATCTDDGDRAELLKLLNISSLELDEVIRQITNASTTVTSSDNGEPMESEF